MERVDANRERRLSPTAATAQRASLEAGKEQALAEDRRILDYLHGATLNFALDEYYGYNFNRPWAG